MRGDLLVLLNFHGTINGIEDRYSYQDYKDDVNFNINLKLIFFGDHVLRIECRCKQLQLRRQA
ncbi:hypothetical protein D3C83_318580 [compost metagenome]